MKLSATAMSLAGDPRLIVSRLTIFFAAEMAVVVLSWVLYITLWKQAFLMGGQAALCLLAVLRLASVPETSGRLLGTAAPVLLFYVYVAISGSWVQYPEYIENNYFIPSGIPVPLMLPVTAGWVLTYGVRRVAMAFLVIYYLMIFSELYSLLVLGETAGESAGSLRTIVGEGLAFSVPFVLWLDSLKHSLFLRISIIAGMTCVLTLGSRTTLLTFPATVLITIQFLRSRHQELHLGRAIWVGIVAAGVLGALFFVLVATGQDTATRILDNGLGVLDYSSSSLQTTGAETDWDRRLMSYVAISSFLEHPILGVGYQGVYGIMAHDYSVPVVAHGVVATILAELGLVGSVLFLWVVRSMYRDFAAGRYGRFQVPCAVGFGALLFHGLFHQLHDSWYFHMFLGLGIALPAVQRTYAVR